MRTNRTRNEIISSILRTCLEPQVQTHIMGQCNLSYNYMMRSLDELLERGLLEKTSTARGVWAVRTTEKGKELLAQLSVVKQYLEVPTH